MEQLSLASKKIFSSIVICVAIFSLSFGLFAEAALGQTSPTTGPTGTQGNFFLEGTNGQGATTNNSQAISNGIAGCAASIVGSALANVVGQLVGKFAGSDVYTRVGTTNSNTVAEGGDSNGTFPGLNAIGYCVINAVLEYLTQATIDWINSGFDGNPAFVDNPEKFFKDIADIETASFLQQVVQQGTGIDICEPFRMQIVTGLSSPNRQYANQSKCTFDKIGSALGSSGFDFQAYTSGSADYSGSLDAWRGISQNDQNNPYGAYFMAQKELSKRLAVKGNTAQLDLTMGKGFLSFKSCNPDSTTTGPDGQPVEVRGACRVTTPGGVIEDQVNRALGAGRDRLILADKFDQIITALVNQLIKTALNEVLSSDTDN